MKNKEKQNLSTYQSQIHRMGRLSSILVVIALILVPVALTLTSGVEIDISTTLRALVGLLSLIVVISIVEFISYAPVLGAGATYLGFITGNIMNLKLPAAINAIKVAEVNPTSNEAEAVSTIAVAVSSIVTVAILLVGMIGISFILPVLQSPILKPAFNNLMPALMGALATPLFLKNLKTVSLPAVLVAILVFVMGFTAFSRVQSLLIPFFLAITIGWRYFLYRGEQKKIANN